MKYTDLKPIIDSLLKAVEEHRTLAEKYQTMAASGRCGAPEAARYLAKKYKDSHTALMMAEKIINDIYYENEKETDHTVRYAGTFGIYEG